jgi:hypothetical protein
MAYGINVYNEYGEEVLEMAFPTLYNYAAGSTTTWESLRATGISDATTAGYGTLAHYERDGAYTTELYTTAARSQVACEVPSYTEVSTGKALIHPEMNLQVGDIPFYDVGTYGLLTSYCMLHDGFSDSTPAGGIGICEIEGNNSVAYVIASNREPITPTEAYGVQLFDSSAARTFDSRQPHFAIYDHFYVSKAIMELVIERDVTINLNLSESHTDFKVAAFNHLSQATWTGGARFQPMIKKVDSDTISISRNNAGTSTETGTYRLSSYDTIIIVGR